MRNYSETTKLRTLDRLYRWEDLLILDPTSYRQIEAFGALYTIRPQKLLRSTCVANKLPFILNYPAKFIWNLFPAHFENNSFIPGPCLEMILLVSWLSIAKTR